MTAKATALERTLHLSNPEMHGPDVAALQVELNKHWQQLVVDGVYGIHTAESVQTVKKQIRYRPVNLNAGPPFWKALLAAPIPKKPVDPWQAVRDSLVEDCLWMIAHHAPHGIDYDEIRPRQGRTQEVPFKTDCSGSSTDGYEWQVPKFPGLKIPNPNGGRFDARAYTGLVIQACRPIIKTQARRGDPVVFGNYPGVHMGLLLEDGTADDPDFFNHGEQGQPINTKLSREIAAHAGQAVHYLTALR